MKTYQFLCALATLGALLWSGCEDKYRPQNEEELLKLVRDKNVKLNKIDTSAITDMSLLFAQLSPAVCKGIQQEQELSELDKRILLVCRYPYVERDFSGIDTWDTSNVENMQGLFLNNQSFNESLNAWNVSKVKDMLGMFQGAKNFNQPLNTWNVSQVQHFDYMFADTRAFSQPLDKWDLKSAKSLEDMFSFAASFSQNLDSWQVEHIEAFHNNRFGFDKYYAREVIFWDSPMVANLPIWAKEPKPPYPHTHKPKDRAELVAILSKKYEVNGEFYEVPLSAIDTSAITDMSFLFANYEGCDFFLTLLKDSKAVENCESSIKYRKDFEGIEQWDTSKVIDMKYMFYGSERFNHSIQSWNVSKVENMRSMFQGAKNFNQPLNAWHTASLKEMVYLFRDAEQFNQPLDKWDISQVESLNSVFAYAKNFNQNIQSWDTSKVINMEDLFEGAQAFNQPLNNWNVSKVLNMEAMFADAKSFNQPLDKWDTSSVKDMSSMFSGAESFNQPLNTWQVGNVYDMRSMFERATKFNQPLVKWNVSNVYKINYMFVEASHFKQDLNMWNINIWNILELEGIPSYVFEGSPLQSNPPKWYKNLVGQKRE
ncbi:BspA family leucine-rich repeat surface protein [Helicobacter typhlonius]|uniref:BspA family leucine-rich repeat surface protein n=6 Tax=Helicobacter typhlonius TaxID=76936 RepID=A0A0S4PSC3_9HELI|nr:BspA family leucine-rich repeat surface protein [Helicobacter typhlonius]TLD79633.1 BspA family leucine-rich repeat surface protein [Helicobacter typhlonius]CUU39219.1 Chitinase [Helicobacter typhlonius]